MRLSRKAVLMATALAKRSLPSCKRLLSPDAGERDGGSPFAIEP